jgi:hypothetical protein
MSPRAVSGASVASCAIAEHRDRTGSPLQLREPEVEELRARTSQHDVRGLEVAMDDTMAMSCVQRIGDLRGDAQRLIELQAPLFEASGERLAVEQRHDDEVRAPRLTDVEDAADVGVIEAGDHARLALEPDAGVGVAGDVWRQQLDGDAAIEPRVTSPIDLAHPAGADCRDDFVRPETSTRFDVHRSSPKRSRPCVSPKCLPDRSGL